MFKKGVPPPCSTRGRHSLLVSGKSFYSSSGLSSSSELLSDSPSDGVEPVSTSAFVPLPLREIGTVYSNNTALIASILLSSSSDFSVSFTT